MFCVHCGGEGEKKTKRATGRENADDDTDRAIKSSVCERERESGKIELSGIKQ